MKVDSRCALTAQLASLQQELNLVEDAVNAPALDAELRHRVGIRLGQLIYTQRKALGALEADIRTGQSLDLTWGRLHTIRQQVAPLFRECLAFVEGALVRGAGLDNGLCRIADVLLDDLSHGADIPWQRFTVLAEGEFYGEMAEIIRIRFPEVSIWSLPIAAHEFGHYLGPRIQGSGLSGQADFPIKDLIARARRVDGPRGEAYVHEHFADVYATYVLGPAYACSCLLLRFDPINADLGGKHHPSAAKRAWLILEVLRQMDPTGVTYGSFIDRLEGVWNEGLGAVGVSDSLDERDVDALGILRDEMYRTLSTSLHGARYTGWFRAQEFAHRLQPDRPALERPKDDVSLADLLNAAWVARLNLEDQNAYAVRELGKQVFRLCEAVATPRPVRAKR